MRVLCLSVAQREDRYKFSYASIASVRMNGSEMAGRVKGVDAVIGHQFVDNTLAQCVIMISPSYISQGDS